MKLDIYKTVAIVFVSSLTGLLFNAFSSNGIPFLKQEEQAVWAGDILISEQADASENKEGIDQKPLVEKETEKPSSPPPEAQLQKSPPEEKPAPPPFSEPKKITSSQAYTLYNQKIAFIDAREKDDYNYGHISGAINIPYYDFEPNEHKLNTISKETPIVTYCGGTDCDLSIMLGNKLFKMGYKYVYIFFGGWNEWIEAGYPVVKGMQ